MDTLQWSNDSFFHGMEVQVNKKMAHGFEVGTSYTWSRSIDGGDGAIASDSFLNSIPSLLYFLPKTRRGPSDFNVTHNLTANYLWNIPSPLRGFAGSATRGWQVGGILTVRSGLPFTPLVGGDPLGLSDTQPFDYPNRVSGPGCSSLVNPRNVTSYIKLQCFAAPNPLNLLGNAGRNVLIGPGLLNLDFSLIKETKINERLNLEFRAEAFNIINHANFNSPIDNSTLFNADGTPTNTPGLIDSVAPGREIQFGLKLAF
jgi:hypothetical protein